jgi:hypothetical protein
VFLFTFVQNRIIRRLRSTLLTKILSQEVGFFDVNSSGERPGRSPVVYIPLAPRCRRCCMRYADT